MAGEPFWLVGYSEPVWDHALGAFVPATVLRGTLSADTIDRFRASLARLRRRPARR
jgi:hypothetical protein